VLLLKINYHLVVTTVNILSLSGTTMNRLSFSGVTLYLQEQQLSDNLLTVVTTKW
jgi:hypothetical protein